MSRSAFINWATFSALVAAGATGMYTGSPYAMLAVGSGFGVIISCAEAIRPKD